VADKDEVEPTDESGSTPPSAAAPDPSDELVVTEGDEVDEVEELDADPTDAAEVSDDDAEPDVDHRELEPAGVAAVPAVAAAGSSVAAERAQARKAKETATRRRDQPVKPERTGPVKFVKESIGELRKVVYPTGQQLMSYFVVVLVFVLFIIAYVGLLDLGLGWVLFRVFGGAS